MKSLDEPPFLSVGTDVSAKYRGAFCEAKIKSTKRLVKVKVTFRKDATTVEVQDDHVKGPLKIGAMVEIKRPDGTYQEAVINKLTDASWYTVVFDDGDEKTLRRSSLCLKGERHFAESQTLDQLPLTNPEHFGTPVIAKKTRGRRSNHVPEDESSTSSIDEDDEETNGDKFLGKVVCVSEDKKKTWVPALVVSPECRDDIAVKKDIFVRSFKDGKIFSVMKSDIRDIDDISLKTDCVFKAAYDQAMEFKKNKVIPINWKAELKEESSSSETPDEDGDTKDDQENNTSKVEEEVEPFPDECENFLQQLYKFMKDRGTPINKNPVLGYRNLNLFKLFRLVHALGGFNNIEGGAVWKQVYQDLGIPVLNSAAGYNVKCAYKKYLYGFEEYCSSTNICFKMDLPTKVAKSSTDINLESKHFPKQENKNCGNIKEDADIRTDYCAKKDIYVLNEEVQNLDTEMDASFICEEEPKGLSENISDKIENVLKEGEGNREPFVDNTNKKRGVMLFLKSNVEIEEKNTGDKVEKNEKMTFESYPQIIKSHVQYDEWMKADKTIRPADKSVPKIKHRRKIKNKYEAGHNRSMLDKYEKSSNQCRFFSRPLFHSCDLNNESSSDCHGDQNSAQGLLKPLEIASILNGLQATENSPDRIELDLNMNKNEKDFNMSHIKCGLEARAEGKIHQETEDSYFKVDEKNDCKTKQEESSDDTDYELEAHRRKNLVYGFDKVTKSNIKSGKRKLPSCDKEINETINDENICCKEATDMFYADIIMSSDEEEEQPKPKVPALQKCNCLNDEKKQKLQQARLYTSVQDVTDKKAKTISSEERLRAKDPKDVWSSIQGQWPKKTLKELFSDSDTEEAPSPPHRKFEDTPTDSTYQQLRNETRDLPAECPKSIIYAIEMKPGDGKIFELGKNKMDFPNSGSNFEPNTLESTTSREYRRPQLTFKFFENTLANQIKIENMKSEGNNTIELNSVTCELQDFKFAGNLSLTGFDVRISSSSSIHLERENKEKADICDSEDLFSGESVAKIHSSEQFPEVPSKHESTSSEMLYPGVYVENQNREYNDQSPKVYKWSFQLSDLEKMTSIERITFLQEKLQELRKHYLSLKSEVASIDRRRKHSKKKEREGITSMFNLNDDHNIKRSRFSGKDIRSIVFRNSIFVWVISLSITTLLLLIFQNPELNNIKHKVELTSKEEDNFLRKRLCINIFRNNEIDTSNDTIGHFCMGIEIKWINSLRYFGQFT
ncbi:AT-rich interactive domain-containing protein 4B isoform X2 [Pyxicephalus adspersus]